MPVRARRLGSWYNFPHRHSLVLTAASQVETIRAKFHGPDQPIVCLNFLQNSQFRKFLHLLLVHLHFHALSRNHAIAISCAARGLAVISLGIVAVLPLHPSHARLQPCRNLCSHAPDMFPLQLQAPVLPFLCRGYMYAWDQHISEIQQGEHQAAVLVMNSQVLLYAVHDRCPRHSSKEIHHLSCVEVPHFVSFKLCQHTRHKQLLQLLQADDAACFRVFNTLLLPDCIHRGICLNVSIHDPLRSADQVIDIVQLAELHIGPNVQVPECVRIQL
mmetsp:Transcript_24760/g.63421  ORF Transcript_24760/g.63421 Transcript_24760/m.63421 type:complete len:273 (+) Transcript_24760:5790-6608(+)